MPNELETAMKWLVFGQAVIERGAGAWAAIRAAAVQEGVEADTAAIDQVIQDAARRKELARQDAEGGEPNGTPDAG